MQTKWWCFKLDKTELGVYSCKIVWFTLAAITTQQEPLNGPEIDERRAKKRLSDESSEEWIKCYIIIYKSTVRVYKIPLKKVTPYPPSLSHTHTHTHIHTHSSSPSSS